MLKELPAHLNGGSEKEMRNQPRNYYSKKSVKQGQENNMNLFFFVVNGYWLRDHFFHGKERESLMLDILVEMMNL